MSTLTEKLLDWPHKKISGGGITLSRQGRGYTREGMNVDDDNSLPVNEMFVQMSKLGLISLLFKIHKYS
jgi:hypothetical protein